MNTIIHSKKSVGGNLVLSVKVHFIAHLCSLSVPDGNQKGYLLSTHGHYLILTFNIKNSGKVRNFIPNTQIGCIKFVFQYLFMKENVYNIFN